MKIRHWLLALLLSLSPRLGLAAAQQESPKIPENYIACKSADEFEQSVEYFRSEKTLELNDSQVVKWSLTIARGCTGALQRFKQIYELLNKSGVDLRKCVEMAASFSKKSDEQTKSFAGLFKTFFLENYFDLDFMTAFEVSEKLSQNPAKSEYARKDFERLYKFCTDQNKLGLPFKNCAQYSLGLLKHYDLFPEGIYPSFEVTYLFLTTQAGAVLSVKEALETTSEVLAAGPLAPENFKRAFNYSVSKKGLDTSMKQSMRIALEVAKASLKEKTP